MERGDWSPLARLLWLPQEQPLASTPPLHRSGEGVGGWGHPFLPNTKGKEQAMRYVVKVGGGAGLDPSGAVADIAALVREGHMVVVVHGCSDATNRLAAELGVAVRHVVTAAGVRSRRTDARDMTIFAMAAAQVNGQLVGALQAAGVRALGLSGVDGAVLRATRKAVLRVIEDGRQLVIRDDFTGRVEAADGELLSLLLARGYVPVLEPVALASDGSAVNVDGDRAAAIVAATLEADALVILTNVPGLLRDLADPVSIVAALDPASLAASEQQVSGGMRRKLIGAREALEGGVRRVILADGRVEHPVTAALAGKGTVIA